MYDAFNIGTLYSESCELLDTWLKAILTLIMMTYKYLSFKSYMKKDGTYSNK